MIKVVVDASVAIKWFFPEVHSLAAARLLDPEAYILLAPDLIRPEIGNTVWKKMRRDEITREEASEILNAFATVDLDIHPSDTLLAPSFELAAAFDRTVYDSLYLALAIAQDCALVTADRKFHSVVVSSPFENHIRWVEDDL